MKFRIIKGSFDNDDCLLYHMQLFRNGSWQYLIRGGFFEEGEYRFSKNQDTQTGDPENFYSQQQVEETALRIDNNPNRVTKEGYIIEKEFTAESLRIGS